MHSYDDVDDDDDDDDDDEQFTDVCPCRQTGTKVFDSPDKTCRRSCEGWRVKRQTAFGVI